MVTEELDPATTQEWRAGLEANGRRRLDEAVERARHPAQRAARARETVRRSGREGPSAPGG